MSSLRPSNSQGQVPQLEQRSATMATVPPTTGGESQSVSKRGDAVHNFNVLRTWKHILFLLREFCSEFYYIKGGHFRFSWTPSHVDINDNEMTCGDKGISAFPEGDSLFKWIATVNGPANTVYEGQTYKLSMEFPSSYPYRPPTVRFSTPCFHPNVDTEGNICLDILKETWSASYDARSILLSIQSLLGDPNNDSPLNPTAARLWSDQEAYKTKLLEKYNKSCTL